MTEKQLRQSYVDMAKSYLGCNEADGSHKKIIDAYNAHKPLARGYAVQYTDEWCATFVSAMAIKCGLTGIIPTECSCPKMVELFQKRGRWVEDDAHTPEVGDIIMYDWQDSGAGDNRGNPDHVGIVAAVNGKVMQIIEGNKGAGEVAYRAMDVNAKTIRGYCCPDFASMATAPTAKKTVDELAAEVIAGKWGTGVTRRAKLEAAGYSYAEVQAAVNAKLTGKKSVTEIAREVIAGKWGNGSTRRKRLQDAGYDPDVVQAAVNKLL